MVLKGGLEVGGANKGCKSYITSLVESKDKILGCCVNIVLYANLLISLSGVVRIWPALISCRDKR